VPPQPKPTLMSNLTLSPPENHDFSLGLSITDALAQSLSNDESAFCVPSRRPSLLFANDSSDSLVHESSTPLTEKEKKGRWQGLLSTTKVPSSFARRPSIPDESVLRVQRQSEQVMMRRLQSSVTYKLALLETHMHRHEDAQVHSSLKAPVFNFFSNQLIYFSTTMSLPCACTESILGTLGSQLSCLDSDVCETPMLCYHTLAFTLPKQISDTCTLEIT
jgi:hypothetical protein